jgi:hypothetical protein
MKKGLLSIILICVLTSMSFSQTSLTYDFYEMKSDSITEVRIGQMASFKVENVNLFVYDVSINGSQNSFNSALPPVFEKFNVININEVSEADTKSEDVAEIIKAEAEKQQLQMTMDGLKSRNSNSPKGTLELYEFDFEPTNDDSADLGTLKLEMQKLDKIISAKKLGINEYQKAYTELFTTAQLVQSNFDMLEKSKTFKNQLINISQISNLNLAMAKERINHLLKRNTDMIEIYEALPRFNKAVGYFELMYYEFINNTDVINQLGSKEKAKAAVKELKEEIDQAQKSVEASKYHDIAQDIATLRNQLLNNSSYSYTSSPVQAEGDEVQFEVKVEPKKSLNSNLITKSINTTLKIPVKGGIKIDFSPGIITTFGISDKSYTSSFNEDSTSFSLKENTSRNFLGYNLGVFLHFYQRSSSCLKFTGSLGIGANSNDLNDLDLYLGFGAILGKRERFIISGGAAFSKVEYLRSDLELGTRLDPSLFSETLTEEALRVGGFLAFTYNLSR